MNRVNEKREELKAILGEVVFETPNGPCRVAVLGCGDKRFVAAHKKLFEEFTHKPVTLTTFDITTDHLAGEQGVIKYDCTLPLPDLPYDITYAHVLLKFIETEKQWELLKNSYDALIEHGIAIHVMDKEEVESKKQLLPNGQYAVPIKRWEERLLSQDIHFKVIQVKFGVALVLLK